MPTTLTLKNIPDEVYQRLKARAMPHVHTRELPRERLMLRMLRK